MELTVNKSLKETWIDFHRENPRVRIRDAAKKLDTTEAELLASFAGSSTLRLKDELPALIQRMPEVGRVMALTRNDDAVHERKGVFEEVSIYSKHVGVVVGKDIDLRMFFSRWAFGFAVFENAEAAFKTSFQIFDAQGTAVMKLFLQDDSNHEAFETLVRDFTAAAQEPFLTIAAPDQPHEYSDGAADVEAFQQAWGALQDTHDFFPMLKKFNVSRLHAMHIAGPFARRIDNSQVTAMLQTAAASQQEIMVFVGNPGNIQIHTGPVSNIVAIPNWINVMDPDFNLHLRTDTILETWAVKKPTADGWVHSIEVFGPTKELTVQFFGKRKPGIPESADWTALVENIPNA